MKKLIVMGIVATMVMGLAGMASAAIDDTWMMQLRPYNGTITAGTVTLGTKVGASDGYTVAASEDGVLTPATGTPAELVSLIVDGQRTAKDVRAPLTGGTKIWDLSLYIVGGAPGTIKLDGWMATSANQLAEGGGLTVKLYQGDNLLWTVPYAASGAQATPQFTKTFDYTGTPISLRLVASVPEPGSMVAMLSGLVGLVGFGIRRRK